MVITFVLIIGVGIYAGTKITSSSQWSGGDKTMGAFAIRPFSARQIGGMSIVGAAQNGYTMGIAGCWYSIAGGVYFLLVGALSKVLRENMVSEALPDFLARRYSTPLARLQSYIWVIFGCIYIPIQLKTIASIIQIVIPSFNSAAAMVCGVTIAAVYTGFAGMKGSSAIGRIVCISTYVLIIFVVKNLAGFGGYGGLISQLPKDYDKLIVPAMPTQQIFAWDVGGAQVRPLCSRCFSRYLRPGMQKASRNGCIIGYIFAAPICILTAIVGMMGRAANDGLGDGATAFAWTVKEFSSPLYAGIIFAVCTMIIAATMATMMMATGTILTNIYKTQINTKASDRQILNVSRWGTHHPGILHPDSRIPDSVRTANRFVPYADLQRYGSIQLLRNYRNPLEKGEFKGSHRQYIGGYYCSGSLGHSRLECENQYRVSGNYCQLYGGNYSDASHIERRYGESLI